MSLAMQHSLGMFDLTGRNALITGGSRGLGLQIAEALVEAGARVMLIGRHPNALKSAVSGLSSSGAEAHWLSGDISQPSEVERITTSALDRLGTIDILVNNAGTSWGAAAEDHPISGWDKVMNLNVRATFLMCQEVGRKSMIPRQDGRIINISSILGLAGSRSDTPSLAYNTSKAAVINFTRALACEWGRFNINVNAIAPGVFPSRMSSEAIARIGEDQLASKAPLGRLGGPNDLKGAALLFASDAGRHITGQTLAVDGGVSSISAT